MRPVSHDTLFFDVDGTLTDGGPIAPELLSLLWQARERGYQLGLCTARSFGEVRDFLTRELGLEIETDGCFTGGMLLEDGHVWLPPGTIASDRLQVLTRAEALGDMRSFEGFFRAAWVPASDPHRKVAGWGTLADIHTILVQPIPAQWQPVGSMSIWKEGSDTPWPQYQVEQDAVVLWAIQQVECLGLQHISIAEAGACALRIVEQGRNKGTAITQVGYDPARLIFCGDSANDLYIAALIHDAGGHVLSVGNALPALKQLAVRVAERPASAGIVELLTWLLEV
jgi:hydroxymethylpyrimidine pyrophosphatase-like HAD family hydrolase